MVRARSAFKPLILKDVPAPSYKVCKANLVLLRGIKEQYYSLLNNSESMLWTRPDLKKRKFNSNGEFLRDANGSVLSEDIPLPHGCVAVISSIKINVPLSYKPTDAFQYVDYISSDKTKSVMYIYIVPKTYCYKLNQTALVLSSKSLRSYYDGIKLYLQNGHPVYMCVVPYNPVGAEKSYRVLATKTSLDFKSEVNEVLALWEKSGVIFPRCLTSLSEPVKGVENCGYQLLNPVLDEYARYDIDKSLADTSTSYEEVI